MLQKGKPMEKDKHKTIQLIYCILKDKVWKMEYEKQTFLTAHCCLAFVNLLSALLCECEYCHDRLRLTRKGPGLEANNQFLEHGRCILKDKSI